MRFAAALTFIGILATSCGLTMADQSLRTQHESFRAQGVSTARFETGAGSLTIIGSRTTSSIDVSADYRAGSVSQKDAQRILENLRLTMEVRGETFFLKSEQLNNWNWGDSGRIDLTITLPSTIRLDVDDGSGSITIREVDRDVKIEDGSGEIEVEGIRGNLVIDDGSGSITVRDVDGSIDIEDGSGGIDVSHVSGSVRIEDGSGSIDVNDVNGDLVVPHDGSGSIHFSMVQGRVDIPRDR